MTPNNLATIISNDYQRIAEAISSGAAWEIWMQVEMIIIGRGNGYGCARELPYPAPNERWRLDLLMEDKAMGELYAIELKVESGTNTNGNIFVNAINGDLLKVSNYTGVPSARRWVTAIGYSAVSRQAFENYVTNNPLRAYTLSSNSINVLIVKP